MLELIETIGPNKVTSIQGDNQFGSKMFTETCAALKIRLWTQVAKEDHIASGNVLGVLDNVTKTLKQQWKRWKEDHDSTKWTEFLPDGLATYNSNPAGGLQDRTPDTVAKDSPISQVQHASIGVQHNQEVYARSKKFAIGQKVRVLMEKRLLTKGKDRWSREVYTVTRKDAYKYRVQNEAGVEQDRRYKSDELLEVAASAKSLPVLKKVSKAVTQQRTERKMTVEEGIAPAPKPMEPRRTRANPNQTKTSLRSSRR